MPLRPRYERKHQTGDSGDDQRDAGQRDRDRILYTSAFRRLAGITQVVAPSERHVVHNRLTHTLEVAQIARRLAERLIDPGKGGSPAAAEAVGGVDPDVVEAAALAHDIGHPPFGHVAEDVLDEEAKDAGLEEGFNGNAQSFRIVTKLALRRDAFPGLNLTCATLNAVLKYPWTRDMSKTRREKWGVYETEREDFAWARAMLPTTTEPHRSAEAELVDWADDVAYAVHDLEDFYRAGLIPLDRLARDRGRNREAERFLDSVRGTLDAKGEKYSEHEIEQAFVSTVGLSPIDAPYQGGAEQRTVLRSMTASLIARYVREAVALETSPDEPRRVKVDPRLAIEVAVLKQLTWHYVIHNPALATQQFGHQEVIRRLFKVFADASELRTTTSREHRSKPSWRMFPRGFQERLELTGADREARLRIVVDFIASLTEQQALDMHHRLTGTTLGSALDAIVT